MKPEIPLLGLPAGEVEISRASPGSLFLVFTLRESDLSAVASLYCLSLRETESRQRLPSSGEEKGDILNYRLLASGSGWLLAAQAQVISDR
jgi:hypothetical protein